MEKIELRVEQRAGEHLDKPWSAVFGLAGGTVGRGGQNKLILPDPESEVARVHAMVRLGTTEAYIANLCERRLILVDHQEVRPGQEVPLPLGAKVDIGPYQILVAAFNPAAASAPAMPSAANSIPGSTPEPATLPPVEPAQATPIPDRPAPHADRRPPGRPLVIPDDFNPFEVVNRPTPKDEWGGLPAQGLTELAQQSHDGLIKALPLSGRLDDALDNPAHSGLPKQLDPTPQLDPLALFSSSTMLASPDIAEITAGRSSELSHIFHLPKAQDSAIPGFGAPNATIPDPPTLPAASAESRQAVQNVGLQTVQGLDLSLFGGSAAAPVSTGLFAPAIPAAPTPNRPDTTAVREPQAAAPARLAATPVASETTLQAFGITLSGDVPAPVPAPAPASQPSVASSSALPTSPPHAAASAIEAPTGSLEALAAAFLDGAGLTPERAKLTLTPEFMRAFGEAFRVAIEGSIDLLAARSEIKQEFRAGVTIIGSSANNPLKFLPNADGVIMQMVGQHFPGFMKPVPAIKEAFSDLRVHQLALMAGIRAAYSEALTRFDPLKMEEQAPKAGLLGNLYDGARKAALWDEYKKNFTQLKNAAEDDMTAFSGQTFVQAYEQAANAAKGKA